MLVELGLLGKWSRTSPALITVAPVGRSTITGNASRCQIALASKIAVIITENNQLSGTDAYSGEVNTEACEWNPPCCPNYTNNTNGICAPVTKAPLDPPPPNSSYCPPSGLDSSFI